MVGWRSPLYVMICFFLAAFKILSLSLPLKSLITMRLGVSLFEFIYLEFIELLGCLYSCMSSNLGSFQTVFFFRYFFSFLSFHFSFSSPALDYVCPLHGVPQDPWVLFTFLQFFLFLFLRLNTFLCPIFKFADSFLLPAQICHSIPLVNFFPSLTVLCSISF